MLSHVRGQQHLKKLSEYERKKIEAGKFVNPMSYIRPSYITFRQALKREKYVSSNTKFCLFFA